MDKKQKDRFYIELGSAIRSERVNKNITQEEIANVVGLNRVSIINIESGKQRVQIHNLLEICKFLKINISDVLPSIPEKESIDPTFEKIINRGKNRFEGEDKDQVAQLVKEFSSLIKK